MASQTPPPTRNAVPSPTLGKKHKKNSFDNTRDFLLKQVARGTPAIQNLQRYRSRWLDFYFIVSSFLGDQILYTYLLSWYEIRAFGRYFWAYDPQFARMFLFLLIFGTNFGNMLKNVFALPRPPSPPLWQHKAMDDFGLPSTHSLNAVSMPWFYVYYLWDKMPSDSYRALLALFFAGYSISMFFSRAYLAAHSPADIVSGIILGFPVLFAWISISPVFDEFIRTSDYAPLVGIVITGLTILFHPRASRPSPSYRYSISLAGLGLGGLIGTWGLRHWGPHSFILSTMDLGEAIKNSFSPQLSPLLTTIASVHIGLFVMLIVFMTVKLSIYFGLGVIFELAGISKLVKFFSSGVAKIAIPHPAALDNLDHPMFYIKDKKHKETPKKDAKMVSEFAGALSVGWCVSYFVPPILHALGILSEATLYS